MTKTPEFFYIGFFLPLLFALTMIGEGIYKILRKDDGFFTLIMGFVFLFGILGAYYLLFTK
jgi:hypothetical protein